MSDADTALPAATRPGRVALDVTDLDRVVGFYRDVVGLDVRSRRSDRATLGSTARPLLELRGDPAAAERGRSAAGLYHTAFLLPSRAALGDALRRVHERWRLDGASDHGVSEALYLSDPEGNGVELYRDRPRAEWPVTDDGRVRMGVDPLDVDAITDLACGASGVPDETTVGHVHLEVGDLAAAERFYVGALGLGVRQRYADTALFLAAGDYHHHLGLNTWNHRRDPPSGRGLAWYELLVPDDAALAAAVDRLRESDTSVARLDDGIAVDDPAGITVRLRPD